MSDKPLQDKVVLVTGASRGLGRALALCCAEVGATLVAVAQTVGALEELDDEARRLGAGGCTLVPQDLCEGDAIDRLGAALYQRFGRLDGLAVAHGILGQLSPVGHIPPKVWEKTLQLNATVPYRLLRSLDPLLRQAEAPRALFITDRAASRDRAYWGAYNASKRALEALIASYAEETAKTRIRVNLAAPPPMATRLRAAAYPGEDAAKLASPATVSSRLLPLLLPAESRHGLCVSIDRNSLSSCPQQRP